MDLDEFLISDVQCILYDWTNFYFVLIYTDQKKADKSIEVLSDVFGGYSLSLTIDIQGDLVSLTITSIENDSKELKIKYVKEIDNYPATFLRMEDIFNDEILGSAMRSKMYIVSAIRLPNLRSINYGVSNYNGTVGVGPVVQFIVNNI